MFSTLRPARSADPLRGLSIEVLQIIRRLLIRSDRFRLEREFAGPDFHRGERCTLPRHTEQSGREFASTDPTSGAQDAALQERRLLAEIPLSARCRVQHFQRPTPSHVSSITLRLSSIHSPPETNPRCLRKSQREDICPVRVPRRQRRGGGVESPQSHA
jgi:hypothetical protein